MSSVATVYGFLIVAYRRACFDGDQGKAERIDAAIRLLEEMWPSDCKAWREMFSSGSKMRRPSDAPL